MRKTMINVLVMTATLLAQPATAQNITVEFKNLTQGIYYTPILIAAHTSAARLYEVGTAASNNLQAMAEGGDLSGLVTDLQTAGADLSENPAGGPLGPGLSTSANISNTTGNDYLSIVAMLLPTNDGFVGLDSLEIPTAPGTYHYYLNAYDAGTEANDELVNGGGAPGVPGIPVDPGANNGSGGTGVTTVEANNKVHVHRGTLGDTDALGGNSDLDNSVHRWLNPVAKVTITID